MKVLVIVPAFNEERTIGAVLNDLKKHGFDNILVVDDGSADGTAIIAQGLKIPTICHVINRGLGAALGTGFAYAKEKKYECLVTFDSDGQHRACDLKNLLAPIISDQTDVVIGSRLLKRSKEMPPDRLVINYLSNIFTFFLYGVWSTDTQSGLRAFNKKALNCITIKTDRMEVSSELLKEVKKNHLRFQEIPIKPIYTQYSRTKGQDQKGNLNSINVAMKMFLRLFR